MSYILYFCGVLKKKYGKIIEAICPGNFPALNSQRIQPWLDLALLPGNTLASCGLGMSVTLPCFGKGGACSSANWRIFWYLSNKHGEFSNTQWFFSGNQCLKTDLYIATWFVWKEHLQRNLFASYQIWGFPAMFPLNSFSDSEKSVAVGIWVCWEMGYPQNSDADEKSWQTKEFGDFGVQKPIFIPNQSTSK